MARRTTAVQVAGTAVQQGMLLCRCMARPDSLAYLVCSCQMARGLCHGVETAWKCLHLRARHR